MNRKLIPLRAAIMAMAFALAACGGGSGDSGGGGSTGSASPPPPPPSPPPPPPPPSTIFTTSLGAPMIGLGYFSATPGPSAVSTDVGIFTNRQGQFGSGIAGFLPGTINGTPPNEPTVTLRVAAVDPSSGLLWTLSAPVGATTVSPLTSVVNGSGNRASVEQALRLFEGSAALSNGTDILTFDAGGGLTSSNPGIARDAARLTSTNIQLLGVGLLLSIGSGDWSETDILQVSEGLFKVGQHIRETGRGDPRSATEVEELIRAQGVAGSVNDDAIRAAAELLADYAAAVPQLVNDPDVASRFQIGLIFDIMPTVARMLQVPGPGLVALSRARTPATIANDFAAYANAPRQRLETFITAGPDYRRVPAGGQILLDGPAGGIRNVRRLWSNDWGFGPPNGWAQYTAPTIDQVTITPGDANRIAVSVEGADNVRIVALPGFTGLASFDYRIRDGARSANGRVWVRVE